MPNPEVAADAEVSSERLGTLHLREPLVRHGEPVTDPTREAWGRRGIPDRNVELARDGPHIGLRPAEVRERGADRPLPSRLRAGAVLEQVVGIGPVGDGGESAL